MSSAAVQTLWAELIAATLADAGVRVCVVSPGSRSTPLVLALAADGRFELPTIIDEHEGFDRGWYAGPVGWLGADGDGELCVALRCGIVERTSAILFAGCGIVADSNPDAEWEESRIKLRAVVAALGIPAEEPG